MHSALPASLARARARRSRLGGTALRRLAVAGLVLAVLGVGFLWFRDSDAVRVREVVVTGVTSSQEAKVRAALRAAATDMTTLHVREDQLRAAAAPYTAVADLRVDAQLPDKLVIEVVEHRPAAVVVAGGRRVAASAGGLLLSGLRPEAGLPTVRADALPDGGRLEDRVTRSAVAVLGGAPAGLRDSLVRARSGPKGLVVDVREGPDLIFGSGARVRAKWAAATRVLADSGAQGAVYLDLRIPERTAAGGVGPIEPEETVVPGPTDPGVPPADVPANPQP